MHSDDTLVPTVGPVPDQYQVSESGLQSPALSQPPDLHQEPSAPAETTTKSSRLWTCHVAFFPFFKILLKGQMARQRQNTNTNT